MTILTSFIPAKRRRHRKRKAVAPVPTPPPAGPTLVQAEADLDKGNVTLSFDRDVDVSAMDVTAIGVGSADTGSFYQGDGPPTLFAGQIVVVNLIPVETYSGTGVKLTALAGNGIVAADDGAAWAGCSGVELPFG